MSSLKKEMFKGILWTAASKYIGIVLSIVISMVLARLISPEEFGIVAIAQVAISFVGIIADLGIGAGIIQNKTLTDDDYDSLFTFTILLATIVSLIILVLSPFLANFYNNSKIVPICAMIAVSTFLGVMNMVPESLFNKNKRFDFIAKRSLFFGLVSGIISIVYALMGGGCYALVLSSIIVNLGVLIVGLMAYPRRLDLHFRMEPLKKIFSFSAFQFLFNLINYFSRNLDKLIIGKALSMNDLGYYQKSYNLMLMPLQNITFVITPVLQPFLSDYQDDLVFIRDKYNRLVKLISTISFPLGIFLYMAAEEIIVMMYGNNWLAAVPAFRILALSIPLQMVLSSSGSIFQATNKTKYLFFSGLLNTSVTVTGFVLCTILKGGMTSFAYAWDITLLINFLSSFIILYRGVFAQSSMIIYKQMLHPICNLVLIVLLWRLLFCYFHFSFLISFICKLSICLFSTYITIVLFDDYPINKLIINRIR